MEMKIKQHCRCPTNEKNGVFGFTVLILITAPCYDYLIIRYIPIIALFILGCAVLRCHSFQNLESFTNHQAGWFLALMHSCPLLFFSALLRILSLDIPPLPCLKWKCALPAHRNQSIKAARKRPPAFHYVRCIDFKLIWI
ncbi:hypothetical protein BKA64DRAFT_26063 [Cadophora sp. MPI-SDFR-AT-0126]|nr:hypothetical protein BKA64DRAFT_26063 [Leotiomycetes sp. MPI-SDFR-AT-0126]